MPDSRGSAGGNGVWGRGRCIRDASLRWLIGVMVMLGLTASLYADLPDPSPTTKATPIQKPRVLVLNSYHPGLSWSDGLLKGVAQSLTEQVEMYVEYMDAKRFRGQDYNDLLAKLYRFKYQNIRFDAVLVADDDAFQFALARQDELFSGLPIIFCGVNHFKPAMLQGRTNITGLMEVTDLEATIELAINLHPQPRQIVLITDRTTTGLSNRQALQEILARRWPKLPARFLDQGEGLSLPQIVAELEQLPPDSLVYYADFFQDRDGRSTVPEDVVPILSQHSQAPIYAHGAMYLGLGVVGGKLVSGQEQGRLAGLMVKQVLAGTPVASIPVQMSSSNRYMFDDVQLRRFRIAPSVLPATSVIINEPVSFVKMNRMVLIAVGLVMVVLVGIIILLVGNIMRRRLAERTLRSQREFLHSVLDHSPAGVFWKDRHLVYQGCNSAFARLAGEATPNRVAGRREEEMSWRLQQVQGSPSADLWVMESAQPLLNQEETWIRSDGSQLTLLTSRVPWYDSLGQVSGVLGVSLDISERKENERKQRRLMAELDHRVKNNLTAVLAIAERMVQNQPTPAEFAKSFAGRLRAMARTHEVLAGSRWQGLALEQVVRLTLQAFASDSDGRVTIQGPAVILPARASLPMGLSLHELATNAVKYGSLSWPRGRLEVTWRLTESNWVEVQWKELDGPAVTGPIRAGIGSELIVGLLEYELRGKVSLDYTPGGLVCGIQIPLYLDHEQEGRNVAAPNGKENHHGG